MVRLHLNHKGTCPNRYHEDMNRLTRRTRLRMGRRGAFLLVWGMVFIVYGIGFGLNPLPNDVNPPSELVFHELIPLWIRAIMWISTGCVAVWAAFRRGPGHDTFGFAALVVGPVLRAASYGFAWLVYMLYHVMAFFGLASHPHGYSRGWVSAVFYLALISSVTIVAGMQEDHGYAPEQDDA